MNTILVFIDGTICDTRHRHHLYESPEFNNEEMILKDRAVPGSINCLQELPYAVKLSIWEPGI